MHILTAAHDTHVELVDKLNAEMSSEYPALIEYTSGATTYLPDLTVGHVWLDEHGIPAEVTLHYTVRRGKAVTDALQRGERSASYVFWVDPYDLTVPPRFYKDTLSAYRSLRRIEGQVISVFNMRYGWVKLPPTTYNLGDVRKRQQIVITPVRRTI